jgi:hypothetical protein
VSFPELFESGCSNSQWLCNVRDKFRTKSIMLSRSGLECSELGRPCC